MAASPNRPERITTDLIRRLGDTEITFIPYNPVYDNGTTPSVLKPWGSLCTVTSMDNPALSPFNEQEIQTAGKKRLNINDGYELTQFNMAIQGNSVKDVAALMGQNMNKEGEYGFRFIGDHGTMGAIVVTGYEKDSNIILCQHVYTNVKMKIEDLPGTGETYNISFYSKNTTPVAFIAPNIVALEVWLDDGGSITNAAAIASNFDLGSGNESLNTASTDTEASLWWSGGTNAEQRFVQIVRDGVELSLSDTTYTAAVAATSDGNFTPPTANAQGNYMIAIYPFYKDRAGYTSTEVPGYRTDLFPAGTINVYGGFWQVWADFVGEL